MVFGNTSLIGCYYGGTKITKIMFGTVLIWTGSQPDDDLIIFDIHNSNFTVTKTLKRT